MSTPAFAWRKLSAAKWEDVWPERLSEFADRLAITALAGAKTIRIEIFHLTPREAERLRKEFGGSVSPQKSAPHFAPAEPRAPIKVRRRLWIVTAAEQLADVPPGVPALVIPAGMAFGTGEHATTLNCLRYLAKAADGYAQPWEMLDLGCGSGILALAARRLGAAAVEAADFDPDCVRTAKANAKLNGLSGVRVRRLDVLEWTPERTWPAITANLYSTILAQIAPKLRSALARSGRLIFSGVLREQEADVSRAFRAAGLRVVETTRQGKWIAGFAQ